MERTELINLILSFGFEVVGHGCTIDRIEKHMNFSNRNIRICLTEDNNHISVIDSDITYLVGGYDGFEAQEKVSIDTKFKKAIEPYLLPDDTIVDNIKNWKYKPYEDRLKEEIREHNKWCRKHKLYDCMVKVNN